MEEYIVYIPNLESRFFEEQELHKSIIQFANGISNPSGNIIHLKEERKLYLRSVAFGTLEFQFVLFDFENNQIIFKGLNSSFGDTNRQLYEILTTLRWDFQPKKMSYVMERSATQS